MRITLCLAAFLSVDSAAVGASYVWTTRYTAAPIGDLCFAEGRFLRIGTGEVSGIATSPDGVDWTYQTVYGPQRIAEVAYADGLYVAVGGAGAIATSTDGLTWSSKTRGTVDLYDVLYMVDENRWFALGFNTLWTSTDGEAWYPVPLSLPVQLTSLAYGNGTFVGVGIGGNAYTTTDMLTWTPHALETGVTMWKVVFGDGRFVALGDAVIETSPDGVEWTSHDPGLRTRFTDVAHNGAGEWVALGNMQANAPYTGLVHTSDFSTWEVYPVYDETVTLKSVAYGNRGFLVLGTESGDYPKREGASLWRPVEGANYSEWSEVAFVPGRWPTPLETCFGDGTFVTLGREYWQTAVATTSTDGVHWQEHLIGLNLFLQYLRFTGGLFIGMGDRGALATSPDGTNWTRHITGLSSYIFDVAAGPNGWVAVCGRDYLTSTDGSDWQLHSFNLTFVDDNQNQLDFQSRKIVAGNNVYLANHYSGLARCARSTDGANWTVEIFPSLFNAIRDTFFCNGNFVFTDGTTTWRSVDGLIWESFEVAPDHSGIRILRVLSNGLLLAQYTVGSETHYGTSADGLSWTDLGTDPLSGCVYGNDIWVAAGPAYFTVGMAAFAVRNPLRMEAGGFSLSFEAVLGNDYGVDRSVNLIDWDTIQAYSGQEGTIEFQDPEVTGSGRAFYRVWEARTP